MMAMIESVNTNDASSADAFGNIGSEKRRKPYAANPEAHYSLEELSIAESYRELSVEMRERLGRGERGEVS